MKSQYTGKPKPSPTTEKVNTLAILTSPLPTLPTLPTINMNATPQNHRVLKPNIQFAMKRSNDIKTKEKGYIPPKYKTIAKPK
jgi:hypothetical protein